MAQAEKKGYFETEAANYNRAYDKVSDLRSFIFDERKRIVMDMFRLKGGKVLDVGCGPAVYTDILSKAGYEIYGVDPSENMIGIAKTKGFENASFFVGTAEDLKFQDGFFDGVICVGVLEYLPDINRAIKEAARVSKHGAIAIFTVPNGTSLLNKLDGVTRGILRSVRRIFKAGFLENAITYGYDTRYISRREIYGSLRKNGFEIEKSRFHIFRLSFLNKLFPKTSLAITKRMNFVSSPFIGIDHIIKARKR
ncbi:MAG: methyltransferase domain-containing protein [Candidatus Omnitrophota bacterium]